MKIGVYPGSFNPWHDGHMDVLQKALKIFDKVIIVAGKNPSKGVLANNHIVKSLKNLHDLRIKEGIVDVVQFEGLLKGYVSKKIQQTRIHGIIRGLRNSQDLEYEKSQQYWNEDLGITIPTVYFITDRKLSHISSSAIRTVRSFEKT